MFHKTVNGKGLRKKARSPSRWAPGPVLGSRVSPREHFGAKAQHFGAKAPGSELNAFQKRDDNRAGFRAVPPPGSELNAFRNAVKTERVVGLSLDRLPKSTRRREAATEVAL